MLPTIVSPPSSEAILNLSAEIVLAFSIATVIFAAIKSRITASSTTTLLAVR